MNLYGSTVTGWTEGNNHLTWAERPIPVAGWVDLKATSDLVAAAGDVTFNTTADFVNFLNQQLAVAGKHATLAIASTAGNGGTYNYAYQYMASKDNTTSQPLPKLILTTAPANAVNLSTFRSADPAVNWPLIVGLGALAALVIVGVMVSRKRAIGR